MTRGSILILALVFSAAHAAPAPPPKRETDAIRKAGKYTLFEGKLALEVIVKNGAVGFTAKYVKGNTIDFAPGDKKTGADWFILPTRSKDLWVYMGADEAVTLLEGENGLTISQMFPRNEAGWRESLKKMPREVIAELPAKLRVLATEDGRERAK